MASAIVDRIVETVLGNETGKTATVEGSYGELIAAFCSLRRTSPLPTMGRIVVKCTGGVKGLNVRNIYGKPSAMHTVFDRFTSDRMQATENPVIDGECGMLVATNGWELVMCDVPKDVSEESADLVGFRRNGEPNELKWRNAVSDRHIRPSRSFLETCMNRVAVVDKGGELHTTILAMAACARAYGYIDSWSKNRAMTLLGGKVYNTCAIADIVTALFKLGNTKIGLYECTDQVGRTCGSTPLHFFGLDADNNSQGILCRIHGWNENCDFYTKDGVPVFSFLLNE